MKKEKDLFNVCFQERHLQIFVFQNLALFLSKQWLGNIWPVVIFMVNYGSHRRLVLRLFLFIFYFFICFVIFVNTVIFIYIFIVSMYYLMLFGDS